MNRLIDSNSGRDFLEGLVEFSSGQTLLQGNQELQETDRQMFLSKQFNYVDQMLFTDLVRTLPGDMLVKVDRASMGCSLEVRVPFLDHRLVEFACKLPIHDKISGGEGKKIVKDLGYKLINKELLDRPKKGFQVPIDQWIRNDLQEWARDLLQFDKVKREDLFDPNIVQHLLKEHLSGLKNHKNELWCLLMVQSWIREYKPYL